MALSSSQRRYYARASRAYHEQLMSISPGNDPAGALAYFKTHSINFEMAAKYGLGFVAEPLRGDERFAGRICIPYWTGDGSCVALNFRHPGDVTPKYLKPHGQQAAIYNAPAYFSGQPVIGIAEGEIDAIAASEHLAVPTIGIAGVTNFRSRWLTLLRDFETVLLFTDGDSAGDGFTKGLAEDIGWRARIVTLPPGEDVASMCAAGQAGLLKQLAAGSEE